MDANGILHVCSLVFIPQGYKRDIIKGISDRANKNAFQEFILSIFFSVESVSLAYIFERQYS